MKRGAKRRFTGLWVYVMIYRCEFLLMVQYTLFRVR